MNKNEKKNTPWVYYKSKNTVHSSCEIGDFVGTRLCKPCVIRASIARVTGWACPQEGHRLGPRLPSVALVVTAVVYTRANRVMQRRQILSNCSVAILRHPMYQVWHTTSSGTASPVRSRDHIINSSSA